MIERLARAQDEIERVIVVDGAQVGKRNAFLRPVGAAASDHPRRPAAGEPDRAVPRAGGGPGGGLFTSTRWRRLSLVIVDQLDEFRRAFPACNRGGRLRSGDARRPHRERTGLNTAAGFGGGAAPSFSVTGTTNFCRPLATTVTRACRSLPSSEKGMCPTSSGMLALTPLKTAGLVLSQD